MKECTARRRGLKAAAGFCLLAVILALLTGCGSGSVFDGSRTSDGSGFRMEYSVLDREEGADLDLTAGDRLRVSLENTQGTVDVIVGLTGKEPVYRGMGQQNAAFILEIAETGSYHISVTGHRAKGSVSFIRIGGERE